MDAQARADAKAAAKRVKEDAMKAKQREKEAMNEQKRREREAINEQRRKEREADKEMKRKEKVAEALDVDRQVGKIAFQERVKRVKEQAKERLDSVKRLIEAEEKREQREAEERQRQEAEERQREENPEQPDYRPQPAKPMRPLPINYQPFRELDKVNFGENRQSYLTPDSLSLRKPLAPNVLDVAAMEREKELAAQRRKAGHKWVMVIPR